MFFTFLPSSKNNFGFIKIHLCLRLMSYIPVFTPSALTVIWVSRFTLYTKTQEHRQKAKSKSTSQDLSVFQGNTLFEELSHHSMILQQSEALTTGTCSNLTFDRASCLMTKLIHYLPLKNGRCQLYLYFYLYTSWLVRSARISIFNVDFVWRLHWHSSLLFFKVSK